MLGRLEATADGVDLTPARRQHRALLAVLLLHAGEVVATDDLVEALWGGRPPETAQAALHGHIHALRKRLGAGRIETQPPGYLFRLAEGDELDVRRVEAIASSAPGDGRVTRSKELREALALFRGEPLAEFRYEAFAATEAARLEALRLTVLEEQIKMDLELGRHNEVVPELERLIVANPLQESLRAQLMLALYRAGRQADALQAFKDTRSTLIDELGIEPSPALQRLERQILNQDPELAAPDSFEPTRHPAHVAKPAGIVTFLFTDVEGSARDVVRAVIGQHGASSWRRMAIPSSWRSLALAMPSRPGSGSKGRRGTPCAPGSASTQRKPPPRTGVTVALASAMRRASGDAAHGGQILLSQTTRDLLRETPLDESDVRDLGQHRLKDLLRRGACSSSRFRSWTMSSLHPTASRPVRRISLCSRRLSSAATARSWEVADLLRQPDVRVVTLTGTGGSGKTRLGMHVAADLLDDFDDGVFFVALAPLADPGLVPATIAASLSVLAASAESPARHFAGTCATDGFCSCSTTSSTS